MANNTNDHVTNPVRVAFVLGTEFAAAVIEKDSEMAVALARDMQFYAKEIARIAEEDERG
jgi:hypothetical protein